jgi:TRAP-type mannitol/chloroaromatic compound transport system permease large subunit
LAALYFAYIIGWALLNPKIAPRPDPAQYTVRVPGWLERLGAEYTRFALPALVWAAVRPRRLLEGARIAGEPMGYGQIARNLFAALTPVALTAAAFATVWWYALVRHAPEAEAAVAGQAALPEGFLLWFWACAAAALVLLAVYYWRFDAEQLEILKLLLDSVIPLAVLTLLVLGSILLGIATPTESAAVGVVGALVLALQARQLTWARLRESVFLTARTSAMVCWLFIGSAMFSSAFALHGGQQTIERWVIGLDLSPIEFLLLTQAIIFLLGWPLEWTEIIVIFVPIFLPMLKHFEIDPILFGTLVAVNLQAAFLSPPVAMSAFYLKGVSPPHVTLNQIFAGMMPYMLIVILCMIVMYLWPGMTLWLPAFLYGG